MPAINLVNYTMVVVSDNLVVRTGPATLYAKTGTNLMKGHTFTTLEECNGWYRIDEEGWVYGGGGKYVTLSKDHGPHPLLAEVLEDTDFGEMEEYMDDLYPDTSDDEDMEEHDFDPFIYQLYSQRTPIYKKLSTLQGIHGMPYQFMSNTDIKLSEIDTGIEFPYGRKFTEKIINKMPLLLLSPCTPVFLDGYSKRTKEGILSMISDSITGESTALTDIINETGSGRYYTTKFNYKDYYEYVNGMCWASAIFLGIGSKIFKDGKTYDTYPWQNYTNDGLKGFFSGSEFVCFYIEAENQITDSFSNVSSESLLDSGLNRLSELGKEIDFLLGAGAGVQWDALHADNYDATFKELSKILGRSKNPAHVIERFKGGLVTIANGGHLIFPEIWRDSQYSKTYDCTIKLVSPDGDTESIYRNILVPMWHMIGLTVPLQMGRNGYRSPFLIKAYYKSLINCEMGIITNMSIRKGGEGSWNIDGLPTEMEINFSFKDLYQILTLTKWKDANMFINNTPLLDFIASACGIVLNSPEIMRKAEMYVKLFENKFIQFPTNVQTGLKQTISNILLKALGGR